MFSKLSRYRKLPEEVAVDVRGRRLRSKALRPAPPAEARFVHRLEEGERLDHLAYKYYHQPREWWRICDANPEPLSPWDLVEAGPRTTARIEINRAGTDPRLPALLVALRRASHTVQSRVLGFWRHNADLAGLRDPGALARLPAPERATLKRFWHAVRDLLGRLPAPLIRGAV